MKCPRCSKKTGVRDTVHNTDDNEVYRRRVCRSCNYSFHTIETRAETDAKFLDNWWYFHRERKRNEYLKGKKKNESGNN